MPAFIQQKPTSLSVTDTDAEICLNTIFESNDGQLIARVS